MLAAGVGASAVFVADVTWSAGLVAGFAFFATSEENRQVPRIALAGGLLGGVVGVILQAAGWILAGDGYARFVGAITATITGVGAGLLLRTWEQREELQGQAVKLRGEAAWLEQRTALSRELHDVVGHQVTAMVVQAEAGLVGDSRRALQRVGDLGRVALSELDRLVVHLRDPGRPITVSAPPRLADIDELLAAPLRSAGIAVDVSLDDSISLEEGAMLAVYRIVQEGLTNVAKHSGASCVWVEMTGSEERVRLRVSDDGVGPSPASERGAGLIGIRERVAAFGGSVELVSRPGGGAILDVTLSLAGAKRSR